MVSQCQPFYTQLEHVSPAKTGLIPFLIFKFILIFCVLVTVLFKF